MKIDYALIAVLLFSFLALVLVFKLILDHPTVIIYALLIMTVLYWIKSLKEDKPPPS